MALRYHPGEIAVQYQAGVLEAADLESNGLDSRLDERARRFLPEQTWAVLAFADGEGRMWASVVHGAPGFLAVKDDHLLEVAAVPALGDPFFDGIADARPVGTLVMDMRTRKRMRFNGLAHPTPDGALRITTAEVNGNCPKYIQRREFIGSSAAGPGERRVTRFLTPEQCSWIRRADTFFIATAHEEAGADASHRGGAPGFVQVLDERQLLFPDYSGNNMFQTLGNILLNPRTGLLFIDFESGDVLQITGRAQVVTDAGRLRRTPGASRAVYFEVDEVHGTPGLFPLRWRLVEPSPFNPELPREQVEPT